MPGRAMRLRWRCAPRRPSSSRRSVIDRAEDRSISAPSGRIRSGCRNGSRASIRTNSASTRCEPADPHDRSHCQSEGRRREDHHRHQPAAGAGAARPADAAHRPRSPGEQHACRSSTCSSVTRSMYDAIAEPARRRSRTSSCRRRCRTSSWRRRGLRWPSSRPSWWGRSTRISGSRTALTPIRADVLRTSSSTARRRWGC